MVNKKFLILFLGIFLISFCNALPWEFSQCVYVDNFVFSSNESQGTGLFFHPNGTYLYIVGYSNDFIIQYNLSTPWDITTASFLSNFSVNSFVNPADLFFKSDGLKLYVMGRSPDWIHTVREYNLSIPWDISTSVYSDYINVYRPPNANRIYEFFFKSDGLKLYTITYDSHCIDEYNLSVPWDITTMLYFQSSPNFANFDVSQTGIFFKPDGSVFYIMGRQYDKLYEYDLSTSWDISTASHSQSVSISGIDFEPLNLFFHPNGNFVYLLTAGEVIKCSLFLSSIGLAPIIDGNDSIVDLILGGGSFHEVVFAYNPGVYTDIALKWSEMWKKENFDSFLGNFLWDMPILLLKYMFRQPGSLIADGGAF